MADELAERYGFASVVVGEDLHDRLVARRLMQLDGALNDLSDALDVPREALGLGRLTLRVGDGTPDGRYDPKTHSLHVTGWPSPGALAHDWFLAFNHAHDGKPVDKHASHFDFTFEFEDEVSDEYLDAMDRWSDKSLYGGIYSLDAPGIAARLFETTVLDRLGRGHSGSERRSDHLVLFNSRLYPDRPDWAVLSAGVDRSLALWDRDRFRVHPEAGRGRR